MDISLEDITIRTDYKKGDIGYIIFMHGDLHNFAMIFEIYVAKTLADFYENLNPEKERTWIAEHNGKIIGTITLKNTEGQAQLRYFLIDPAYRGIGLGRKLLGLFMDFMKKCGYKSSFLLTEAKLKTATHLYLQYGYKFASSREADFGLVEQRYEMVLED